MKAAMAIVTKWMGKITKKWMVFSLFFHPIIRMGRVVGRWDGS